ncbi:MAG: outer membrane beta-barrel protein [Halioglobus sp.]
MQKITPSAALLTCLLPNFAIAESPNWTFVEASYLSSDVDMDGWDEFGGIEPTGFELAGSIGIGDWVFVDVRYSEESDEIDVYGYDVDIELDRLSAGVGAAWAVTDTTDFYGRLAYEDWSIEASAIGYSDRAEEDGYSYAVGVRSILWEVLELRGELDYIADETQVNFGAYYTFLPHFTLGASYTGMDNLETLKATFRFQF